MSVAEQQTSEAPKKRGRPRGRAFPKGVSPNPGGRVDGQRYRETFAALAAELGGETSLLASQRVLIDAIAKLRARGGQRDQVRVANTVAKLMRLLGLTRKAKPAAAVPLTDKLAAVAAADKAAAS
jgi:hypothetical protein